MEYCGDRVVGGACCIKNVKALPKVIFKPAKHQMEHSLRERVGTDFLQEL